MHYFVLVWFHNKASDFLDPRFVSFSCNLLHVITFPYKLLPSAHSLEPYPLVPFSTYRPQILRPFLPVRCSSLSVVSLYRWHIFWSHLFLLERADTPLLSPLFKSSLAELSIHVMKVHSKQIFYSARRTVFCHLNMLSMYTSSRKCISLWTCACSITHFHFMSLCGRIKKVVIRVMEILLNSLNVLVTIYS